MYKGYMEGNDRDTSTDVHYSSFVADIAKVTLARNLISVQHLFTTDRARKHVKDLVRNKEKPRSV